MKTVSYNVLAKRFAIRDPEIETFEIRGAKIISSLLSENACVICLQEVELADFEMDFSLLLNDYDYFAHTVSKKRSSPIGNVTLWKKDYKKIMATNTSAAVLVSLMVGNRKILLANVHLKAQLVNGEKQRLSQLASILTHNPDLICGDFNDTMTDERAAYRLICDKYKILTPGLTCYAKDSCNFTINKPYWPFDHFVYKEDIFKSASVVPTNLDCIIPNEIYPSDHLMVVFNSE